MGGWKLDGWMDGWVGGWESGFKDCLQQSKIKKRILMNWWDVFCIRGN